MHKHALLVTKITTLFMWFFILSLTAESMASFTPADLILCHLNTNLLHLKCAMIPDYLTARWNHNQKKKAPVEHRCKLGKKRKKLHFPSCTSAISVPCRGLKPLQQLPLQTCWNKHRCPPQEDTGKRLAAYPQRPMCPLSAHIVPCTKNTISAVESECRDLCSLMRN